MLYSPDWQRLGTGVEKESLHAHAKIAEAVMAGDGALARTGCTNTWRRRRVLPSPTFNPPAAPRLCRAGRGGAGQGCRGGGAPHHRIIVAEDLQPGELVGTEPELIEREGVSRALLREAVRLLEHHDIARMRRGPGGGLFVLAPSADAVTETAAIYLARHGMRLAELAEMRTNVEVAIADLAAERIDDAGMGGVAGGAWPTRSTRSTPSASRRCTTCTPRLPAAAHNRGLELVALVLIRLSRLYQIERLAPKARKQIRAEVRRAMRASPPPWSRAIASWRGSGCGATSRRWAP